MREERCASYAIAYIRDKMARQRSKAQRRIPHPYKDSGDGGPSPTTSDTTHRHT